MSVRFFVAASCATAIVAGALACNSFGGADGNNSVDSSDAASDAEAANDASSLHDDANATDSGAPGTDASVPIVDPCADGGVHRVMFVTGATYRGDLGAGDAGTSFGTKAATARCNEAAAAAGLPGTYVAWLSSTMDHPVFSLRPNVPIVLPHACEIVAADLAALESVGPAVPVDSTVQPSEMSGRRNRPSFVRCRREPRVRRRLTRSSGEVAFHAGTALTKIRPALDKF